jgi:prepilin-type processing-associated H-X9-DG protein
LACPDNRPDKENASPNWLAWVANSGLPDVPNQADFPPDWPANGVFLDHFSRPPGADYQVSLAYLNEHDGAEHTLLLSENVDAGLWTDADEPRVAFVWAANLVNGEPSPQNVLFRINRRRGEGDGSLPFARPSSYHAGGVNAAFCDGATRFLSENVDYMLFCRLMTPDGTGLKQPGSNKPIAAPYGSWLH